MATDHESREYTGIQATRRTSLVQWLATAIVGCLAAAPLEAAQLRPVNLEELTARADRIFFGRCIETEVATHPLGFGVTRVLFAVERSIKGDLGSTLTVEVFGAAGESSARLALDLPRFAPGERMMLFLYPDGALGLTSPVALGQGKFALLRDKQGQEIAVNGLGNRHLLEGLSPAARERLGPSLLGREGVSVLPSTALLDGARALLELQRTASPVRGGPAATGGAR